MNLFVGRNGHGKTNVLEALQFFEFGRSFRTLRDTDLIHFDSEFCRFEVGTTTSDGDKERYAASVERSGGKRIKVGEKDVGRYSEMIGRYPCVLFGPHDLAVVSGLPAERRKFVDAIGSMTDRGYLQELRSYRRVVRQRNAAFKARRTQEALGVWTEDLIQRGCAVTRRRIELIGAIEKALEPHINAMGVAFEVKIRYESELIDRPEEVTCEEQFAARLASVEAEETRRGITMVGPHRDDITITADGHDLRRYGSQGQRRLMAILLRLAELSHLEAKLGEPCVLLLDDMFSELDETVTQNLKRVLTADRQVFVTSPIAMDWVDTEGTKVFHIEEGRVRVEVA